MLLKICSVCLFFVVNTVLFSIFLVFVWRYFFYIIDYYIYKGLKEFEKEGKILVILCENLIFLSIFAEYRGTC